jgi:DNA-binding IclR family transcriptional regulator
MRRQYCEMRNTTGVGVVDKVALILNALANEPVSLAGLVELTGITRPTAHRLAVALETHRLVSRDSSGRFTIGPRVAELAGSVSEDRLVAAARPVLARLHELTNESVQLYRRRGEAGACIAAVERTTGLRDSVPVGSLLSMRAGSGAQVLLAWADPDQLARGLRDAKFNAASLGAVRRRGWAQSVAEREAGVASVSAPVRNASGAVIAAISISGPIARVTSQPGRRYAVPVMAAASQLSSALAKRRPIGP